MKSTNRRIAAGLILAFITIVAVFNLADRLESRPRTWGAPMSSATPTLRPLPIATAYRAHDLEQYRKTTNEVLQRTIETDDGLVMADEHEGVFASGQATEFAALADSVDQELQRLNEISPPAAYAGFHWRLVEMVMCYRDSYRMGATGDLLHASELHTMCVQYCADLDEVEKPW